MHERLVAILGAMLLVLPACGRKPAVPVPPLVVRCEPAAPVAEVANRSAQTYLANIRGDRETDLSFKVGGVLEGLGRGGAAKDWEEGSPVEKGEVLARLKQADFTNAVIQARAKAELDRSQLERGRKLRQGQDISPQALEVLEATAKSSQALLESALQALADSEVQAPFSGRILARLANRGETVLPGQRILRVADLGIVSVEVGVPDRVVSAVRLGQEIPLTISALEGTNFLGRVTEVGVAAQPGTRLFKVVLKVDNPSEIVKSGMTASLSFAEKPDYPTNAVVVPLSALLAASRGAAGRQGRAGEDTPLAVFVAGPDDRARERLVHTADILGSSIVVTQGLAAGERVVVAGASLLYEGAPVEARRWDRK
jgi:RND family efflux transporter MFP subunit